MSADSGRCFDLAVIGSGPGGYRAAELGALRGLKVAIVEADRWGGCCLNRGCVPKRAWYARAQSIAGRGSQTIDGGARVALDSAWSHQRHIVDQIRLGYTDYLARLGVACIAGHAAFVDTHALRISASQSVAAAHVIVATGATPIVPPGLALVAGRVVTTDDLFQSPLPAGRRVAVIGAGPAGTELAFILSMLGCDVRWIARGAPLESRDFSPTALRALDKAMNRYGVRAIRSTRATSADDAMTELCLRLDDGREERVDWVVLATGRRPHTAGLALGNAGICTDGEGFIAIDERCATSAARVFAIGDVVNRGMSANLALADAAVAIENILAPGAAVRRPQRVPQVVYAALELARIGQNEDQAEAAGLEPAAGFAAFAVNPAALAEQDTEGYVRLVADRDRGVLLGAEIVGRGAGDLMQMIAQSLGEADALRSLARLNYNHPSRAEEIRNAVQTLASSWGMAGTVYGD